MSHAQTAGSDTTTKIGVIQSLTGIAAEDGKTTVQALKLAAEEINASAQTKIQLIVEDDQTEPKSTVSAFQKLKNDGVKVIIGATWSFTTNAIVPLAAQNDIVLVNTSTIPECLNLDEGKGFVFSNVMRTEEQARNFEQYLLKYKILNMVVVSVNNSWGESQRRIFVNSAQRLNVDVLDSVSSSSFDSNDWSTLIPRIRSKSPQLILLLLNKNDLSVFIRKAKEQGLKTKIFASYHFYDSFKMSDPTAVFNGVCFPYPLARLKGEANFITKYEQHYGEEPKIFADNSYDALFLIAKAQKTAQERNISLEQAVKASEFDGLVGRYRYSNETSLGVGKSSLICVEDQKLVEVN